MVINGGSRSSSPKYATWLGAHLNRTDTNERVFLRRLDGVTADDLSEALAELSAMASGARSQRGLYHANIDWRHDEQLTEGQKDQAVKRLADELGLAGQPHVVVEHAKEGRDHLHVVWLRIDPETGKAIPDSHNFRRHEIVARELEREFGLERVQGVHVERDGIERPQRTPEAHEFAQAARTGLTPAEAKAEITGLWHQADSGQAFAAALDGAGWTLARGDKRDFVVIDPHGEAHSLARRVEGVKVAQVRARMADIDPATLPSVDEARQAARSRQAGPGLEMGGAEIAAPAPEAAQRPACEAAPEPPPDLDARFGPIPAEVPENSQQPPPSQDTPEPPYVPNFVLVVDLDAMMDARVGPSHDADPEAGMVIDATPEAPENSQQPPSGQDTPQHRQAKPHQVDEPEAVRRQEPAHGPRPSAADADARRAPEDMRREMAERMRGFAADPQPEPEPERQDPAPEPQTPDPGRLARAVAAARERLAALAHRLDVAFERVRDQVLRPEPRPRPEPSKPAAPPTPEKVKAMDDNAAVILETMRQQQPEPTRPRSVAEELLQRGRQHREQHPEPERDRDQEFGPRRRRMPWEPSL